MIAAASWAGLCCLGLAAVFSAVWEAPGEWCLVIGGCLYLVAWACVMACMGHEDDRARMLGAPTREA